MKNTIKIFLIISILGLISCSKEYLDTVPTDQASPSIVFKTVANAEYAINGLNVIMSSQKLESQGYSGEGVIKLRWGNFGGNNTQFNLGSWASLVNFDRTLDATSIYSYYPWFYYYMIIANTNIILENIENIEGPKSDIQFINAQALTFRAYAYMMLVQFYAPRWVDSNNGTADAVVLRLDTSIESIPLSSLADSYAQIYADLDSAIDLYTSSGNVKKNDFDPDINVAYAIYARAAINKSDYTAAKTYAPLAREGHPLMSNSDYKKGFSTPNGEWIWYNYGGEDEQLYYYSYHAYIGFNANTSWVRGYAPCISKELYTKIPTGDIRRDVYLDPKDETYNQTSGEMNDAFSDDIRAKYESVGVTDRHKIFAYMNLKHQATANPGVGNVNHFRSSEMYLIEAEAKFHSEDEEGARAALIALNKTSDRNPNYTCTLSGDALLDEIKFYYQVELWGEGFDWFLMKRWKDSISRKSFANGGNFNSAFAVDIAPSDKNNWTYVIPKKETDYNTEI